MAEDTGQERNLPATPRKRNKARQEGQVAKSREVNTVMLLGGALGLFALFGADWMRAWAGCVHDGLGFSSLLEVGKGWEGLYVYWIVEALTLLAPFWIVFVLLSFAANLPQVGFHITPKVLTPKLSKLNPASGLKRIFSLNGLVEVLKAFGKVLIIGWLAYDTVRPEVHNLSTLRALPLLGALRFGAVLAFKLVLKVWLAMLVLAFLDYLFQKWNFEKELRMTKQEVKEEMKETEGDPKVKSRIRSVQMNLARQRMMQEVPKADVVITNPDHVAVALRYDRLKDMAPVVVAKGAGLLCERVKEIAREHYVPVVENPPLARFLYRNVDLDQEIPVEMYRVVAEVLTYVYRLKNKVTHGVAGG
jgi:flagellar biosynthetic protein FlhB